MGGLQGLEAHLILGLILPDVQDYTEQQGEG